MAIELNIETNYHTINSDAVLGSITVKAIGYYDELIRHIWSQAQEKDKELRKIFSPIFNTAQIDNIKVLNIDDLFSPVTLTFDIRYETETDLSEGITLGASYQQLLQGFTSFLSPLGNTQRQHRLFNHTDITLNIKTIVSDERVKSASTISSPSIINTPYIQATYKAFENEEIGASINIRITPFSLLPEKRDEFIRTIKTANEKGFWLTHVKSSSDESPIISDQEGQSIPSVKAFIDNGRYDEALTTLLVLLEENELPEGYYLKGLILGHQNKYDESDKAFEKAVDLGYEL
ncbi:tetratricopeptide repeat protein [Pseudomonas sp. HK3]